MPFGPTKVLLAIEIGGTKLQLVAGTEQGEILERMRLSVDHHSDADGIRELLRNGFREWSDSYIWRAAGIGYGGPVDHQTGVICRSFHVNGWDDFPLGDWLQNELGVPVVVENDSNVAALAEATLGAGRGSNPVFYTNSGSGVGGGLVVNQKIYHGLPPGEVEFGHLRLDRSGRTIEDACSGWAVDEKVRRLAELKPDTFLGNLQQVYAREKGKGGEARLLSEAFAVGDPDAHCIIHETAQDLAFGLSHVVHLFHPERIVLGGGLALLGEPWREAVARALPPLIMEGFAPGQPVVLSELGEDVVPRGALLLAASRLKELKK
jgi:glucokinase